jgi:hypothetical protein
MNGRRAPDKPVFEFENGEVARLNRVSPTIAMFLRHSHPPPPPPIDTGTGDPNPDHPHYRAELAQHNEWLTTLTIYMMIDFGVDMEVDEEEAWRLHGVIAAVTNVGNVSPRAAYIAHVVCSGDDEVSRLVKAIQGERVTDQEVQTAAESFRDDVEGTSDMAMPNTEITLQH